ncbi:hypothetical protein AZE42_09646 [Rhizopogon vesiculosus]|uniref:Uncharacterized protein n=1 Tax=Rhizopogon vesiculosus TaxID=180088 RepID=A0A1J8QEW6_9AGAM|nr:hypothetical protein AZE42_09646 [Rhizopogon vesiculosus]
MPGITTGIEMQISDASDNQGFISTKFIHCTTRYVLYWFSYARGISYFQVACLIAVVYDWGAHDTIVYRANY